MSFLHDDLAVELLADSLTDEEREEIKLWLTDPSLARRWNFLEQLTSNIVGKIPSLKSDDMAFHYVSPVYHYCVDLFNSLLHVSGKEKCLFNQGSVSMVASNLVQLNKMACSHLKEIPEMEHPMEEPFRLKDLRQLETEREEFQKHILYPSKNV